MSAAIEDRDWKHATAKRRHCTLGFVALAWAVLLAAVPATWAYDPFQMDPEHFAERVEVLALAPVVVDPDLDRSQHLSGRLEAKLLALSAGRDATRPRVLASAVHAGIWRSMSMRLGGIYDPRTGRPDSRALDLVSEHTRRELDDRYAAGATLWLRVEADEMDVDLFSEGWFADRELLNWRGSPIPAYYQYVPQRVLGYFLSAHVVDLFGRDLYRGRVVIAWNRIYLQQGFEDRDPTEGIGSDLRLDRAVESLLAPLLDALVPAALPDRSPSSASGS